MYLCIYFCKLHTYLSNFSTLPCCFSVQHFLNRCDRGHGIFFFLHHLDHGLETPVKQKILFPVKGVVIRIYDKKFRKTIKGVQSFLLFCNVKTFSTYTLLNALNSVNLIEILRTVWSGGKGVCMTTCFDSIFFTHACDNSNIKRVCGKAETM